jgi:sigma-B regulation protein RsbU (phosphoserine phosphatase)
LRKVQIESLLIGVFIFVLSSLAVLFISRAVTRPLSVLTGIAADIAGGNLDREIPPVKSVKEVGELADAFRRMKTSLKDHIEQLTKTTAAKERIESELNIAHNIQMSILPKIFPPFPDKPDAFDLYAVIKPAKEVGGDFYDFFYIDDTHFCFVIGDVSGKGVPASLFMAVTKTLIKGHATGAADPGKILSAVNDDLSDENDACMFVTVFLGILDTKTGEILYANGGHNPPVLVNASGIAGFLDVPGDIVVGAVEGFAYQTTAATLGPDDAILLYTDGVTEAMNHRNVMFSEVRLMETLSAPGKKGVKETLSSIMEDTARFVGEAPQSDDITLLMLRFKGAGDHILKEV